MTTAILDYSSGIVDIVHISEETFNNHNRDYESLLSALGYDFDDIEWMSIVKEIHFKEV